MATHSSTLAWKIPWTRSLVGYSLWGRKELNMTERLQCSNVINSSTWKEVLDYYVLDFSDLD